MSFDFPLLQSFNLLSKDNLIFFAIILILFVIIVTIILWIIYRIIKIIRLVIVRFLNIDLKPNLDRGKSTEWLHKKYQTNRGDAQGQNKEPFFAKPIAEFTIIPEKTEIKKEDKVKSSGEKEKADIVEGLSKLKSKEIIGGGIESKMPSRTDDKGDNQNREIKIPVPAHHSSQPGFVIEQNNGGVGSGQVALPHETNKDGGSGSFMFENKSEISRIKLRHALRYDPKAYKAQKEAGLYNMNRAEREELVKEVFAPVYGRNISKADLNKSIKKLGTKMRNAINNPEEHAKLRKEIKFFKKIGGIK